MRRSWALVFIGAIIEVLWVIGLKHSDSLLLWIGTIVGIGLSFLFAVLACLKLPVGTVYAVFTGLGTTGTVLVEMFVFGEPFQTLKIVLVLLLLTGVLGLKFVTKESDEKGVA
ncbi:DMT family transporter [Paenibacillus donghaensis]|uniref:QacE family quaternary ammonium compound efflux SMR transporter n=1 Tax=Paenibacillus donghaensis TaxID=414771 RepID=A0A2Z2KKX8_9BACL|nr:SMR family transporter [Paenibacillus donghaensis]ASA24905.1 QacE family quaternary ammonium compound efflux SMR transporter [Paenibacillus donghaensis]